MTQFKERKIHWRPTLNAPIICGISLPAVMYLTTTGYLLGTLRKVTCKNCIKQLKKDPNVTIAIWEAIKRAYTNNPRS